MALALIFYLLGYLEVRVTGSRPERFLNLAVARGIYFWNVRRSEDRLELNVGLWAFRRLRPVARRTRCRVRILRRRGLPFLLRRASSRRILLAGAAAAAAAIYLASSFVWVIEVRGLHAVPEVRVLRALAALGVRPGVPKGTVDLERVANLLPMEVRGISWAGVHLEGTKAVVEVAEKVVLADENRPETAPADLVAAKDGLVTHFLVLVGEPLVREGQMVRAGQTLIRGVINPWGEGEAPKDAPPPPGVRARGIVQARVWYDTYVETPLVQEAAVRTGAVRSRRIVRLAGREIALGGRGPVPFDDYQLEETHLRPPRWRNASIPVEFLHLRYYEVRRRSRPLTRAEALARAEAEARRRLLERIPLDARILKESVQVVRDDGRLIGVRMLIETEEAIGRPVEASQRGPGRGR